MSRIAVTGAGGVIGSHAVSLLGAAGFAVTAIYHNRFPYVDKPGDWLQIDVANREALQALQSCGIDTLVHCAAVMPQSFLADEADVAARVNRRIDGNVIEYCEAQKIRLVYISGCSLYGLTHDEAKCENAQVSPTGPYLAEKYWMEQRILASKLRQAVILRVSSPYGKNQMTRNVLKIFIEKAINNETISYYGSGLREQDFIHCDDVAAAIEKVILQPEVAGIFNIAYGKSVTMKQLAECVVESVGSESRIYPGEKADPQDGYRCKIDIAKAGALLGWKPAISLREGIEKWAEYLRRCKA